MLPESHFICKNACENKTAFIKIDLILCTEKKPTIFGLYGYERPI